MSQAGYTPIQLYFSTTAAAVPVNTNLANGELAINITDGKLYYKDNTGTVKLLAGATAGPAGGSNTQVQFNSSGVLAGSSNMTFNGTTLTVNDLTDSSLTATRVTYAGTAGNLVDSANLTFDGTTFSAPNSVITSSSSSTALRITQTGAGDALLVEDSANPDSTPFVVDASGNVGIGATTGLATGLSLFNSGSFAPVILSRNSTNDSGYSYLNYQKSRAGSIVQSGDGLGAIIFNGYDGASFLQAALIRSDVDGTPGTNDMPGRLVFSTTADGASSPTERMRIRSDGAVGIGGSGSNSFTLNINRIPTAITSWSAYSDPTISATVTTYNGYESRPSTIASAFTVGTLQHYVARQGTIGASSAVTNQFGYAAHSSLTGATNNYGFYGDIASGTGRYNLFMNGTADNYMAGSLGIGTTATTGYSLVISKTITGATTAYSTFSNGVVQSDVTTLAGAYTSALSTAASAFTLGSLRHFYAAQGTIGAGSTVTNQYGFFVDAGLTGATNNYGFFGNIASGTGRYNLYMQGTAVNYMAGSLGIGTTTLTQFGLRVSKTITGNASSYGVRSDGVVQSDVTSQAYLYNATGSTAASAFTLSELRYFSADQSTIGAGSTVTNQYGFIASPTLIGATNNYGFYGDIASGTGRYNLYMAGTAQNYFAGNVGIATTSPGSALDVKGTLRLSGATSGYVGLAPAAAAGSTTYTLPSADGTTGQFLSTNGSGTLSWATGGGGGSQWTTSGSNIYYSTGKVGIGTSTIASQLDVRNGATNASGINTTSNQISITHNSNNGVGNQAQPAGFVVVRDKASAVSSGDFLGGLSWNARYTDTEDRSGYASILAVAAGAGTAGITFNTSSTNLTTEERMSISSAGYVGIGNLGATGLGNGQLTVGGASGIYATLALSTEPSLGIAGVRAFDGTTGSVMCVLFQVYGGYNSNAPRTDGRGNTAPAPGYNMSWQTWPTSYGYWVEAFSVDPLTYFRPGQDNARSLGTSSNRWSVVYAATGSINTSDINVKEQIAPLDDAEKRVATAIKGLIKKFKFKDAVQEKGENARIHVGVIAQEVSAAFIAEGLDPTRYALFCEDTWWQKESFEQVDENDETSKSLKVEYFKEETEGCTEHTRLGIRYDELFAFLISTL